MQINDKIKDNDPRSEGRILVIEALESPHHVRVRRILSDGTRNSYPKKGFRISRTRIHTDGKPRKSGYSLLPNTLEGCFYVGTSPDASYPGIISGPFTVPPRLSGPGHTLWRAVKDKFVREENLEFR